MTRVRSGDGEEPRRRRRLLLVLGLAWLLIAMLGVWAVTQNVSDEGTNAAAPTSTTSGEGGDESSTTTTSRASAPTSTADVTTTTAAAAPTTTSPPETAATVAETTTTTVDEPAPAGPAVIATLSGADFELSGTVPDEETASQLRSAAEVSYAPFVDASGLSVDPDVGEAAWLDRAPAVIGLLPMITDGSIRFGGDGYEIAGRSPNSEYLAAFEATLTDILGAAPRSTDVTITDLTPPRFDVAVEPDVAWLRGTVQTDEVRDQLIGAARQVYGDAVRAEVAVDPSVYTSFWMYTMPQVFQLFSQLGQYEFSVAEGAVSGAIDKGVTFGFDSAQLTPAAEGPLTIAGSILQRDRSIGLEVIGHADSTGPADYNLDLSRRRAQAVADALVAAGISSERLFVDAMGEAEPMMDNTTEDGRAANRRVGFRFDLVSRLGGSNG